MDEFFGATCAQRGRSFAIAGEPLYRFDQQRDPGVRAVAEATEGFSGAELAALVPDALFTAFADSERDLQVGDLLEAARNTTPLSKTAEKKIQTMREWSVGRARPASTPREARLVAGQTQAACST